MLIPPRGFFNLFKGLPMAYPPPSLEINYFSVQFVNHFNFVNSDLNNVGAFLEVGAEPVLEVGADPVGLRHVAAVLAARFVGCIAGGGGTTGTGEIACSGDGRGGSTGRLYSLQLWAKLLSREEEKLLQILRSKTF